MANELGRPQFLNQPNPKTIYVIDSRFNDEIMVINEESFDKKLHKRCNEFGQLTDARGVVIPEHAAGPTKTSPQSGKASE